MLLAGGGSAPGAEVEDVLVCLKIVTIIPTLAAVSCGINTGVVFKDLEVCQSKHASVL